MDKYEKIYSIKNETGYENIEYYTITNNNQNNKVDIRFDKYINEKKEINYMKIDVIKAHNTKEIYDIVIDPGHGGKDCGATRFGYEEAKVALDYSIEIKQELEKLGFKVRLTRDGTEGKDFNGMNVYDKDGRVNIIGDSKAKYSFSIHLNSLEQDNSQKGVEVYAPSRANLSLAKSIADNIVKYGNTSYSGLDVFYKKENGVYVRTFTKDIIANSEKEAIEKGYKPYNITEDTPYLFMVREVGGIATKAYVDGRNTEYGTNLYYNSNIGVEGYLIELGYINHEEDLKNMLDNKEGYIRGIVKAIYEHIIMER